MPNRILREGILTSKRIEKLGWAEEVFYRRLMSIVDDFGRYYADAGLLHAACYPRQLTKVSDSDIGKWLTACVNAALVRVYPAQDGERYLQLLDFGQQVRAKKSRFPEPLSNCAADAAQAPANAPVSVDVSVSEDESGKSPRKRVPLLPCPDDVPEQVWSDWLALRRGKSAAVTATVIEGARDEAEKAGISFEAFLRIWCVRGTQGLQADWIKPDEKVKAKSFRERDAEAATAEVQRWAPTVAKRAEPITLEMEPPHGTSVAIR